MPRKKPSVEFQQSATAAADRPEAVAPKVPEEPSQGVQPRRRRKKRRVATEDYFPQESEQSEGRFWRICLWSLILIMAAAWALMLTIQFGERKEELQGDKVYRIDKQDVVPDL